MDETQIKPFFKSRAGLGPSILREYFRLMTILMISQINVVFFGSMKKPAGLLKDRFILNSSTTRYRDMNLMTHSYHGNVICLTI